MDATLKTAKRKRPQKEAGSFAIHSASSISTVNRRLTCMRTFVGRRLTARQRRSCDALSAADWLRSPRGVRALIKAGHLSRVVVSLVAGLGPTQPRTTTPVSVVKPHNGTSPGLHGNSFFVCAAFINPSAISNSAINLVANIRSHYQSRRCFI